MLRSPCRRLFPKVINANRVSCSLVNQLRKGERSELEKKVSSGMLLLLLSVGILMLSFSSQPVEAQDHNVVVTHIYPWRTIVGNSTIVAINVTVQNQGDSPEDFDVSLNASHIDPPANEEIIGQTAAHLEVSDIKNVTFNWEVIEPTYATFGNYQMKARANSTSFDNTFIGGLVFVTIAGDVNGDRMVEGKDLTIIARCFGATYGIDPRYKPNADIDGNRMIEDGLVIEGKDLARAARNFGKGW